MNDIPPAPSLASQAGLSHLDIEERVEMAKNLFTSGYNCCQAVILAYHDIIGIDPKLAATISGPLGGGMGRLREVCGAVSGMFLLSGFIIPADDPQDRAKKTESYTLVQELAATFRENTGSIICRELLGIDRGQQESPIPSQRTQEYYQKRPCAEIVALAARIIGQKLKTKTS